jgi:protein TonB
LAKNVKFPAVDRENGTSGKAILTFVVEKDGSLTDIKVLRAPSPTIGDAAVQAVQQSPKWAAGIQNGRPVRVQFTISFAFSLADADN